MPLMDADATRVIRVKEFGENRRHYDETLRRLKGPVT